MAETGAGADEVAANRELWTQANSEYADEHALRASVILAEIGIDMSRFLAAGHLVSWAKFAPGHPRSPPGRTKDKNTTGHGNSYLARVLGNAAVPAGRPDTFLGERYQRIARAAAGRKPWSPSAGPRCSSFGICSPIPASATPTSAATSTQPGSAPNAASATSGAVGGDHALHVGLIVANPAGNQNRCMPLASPQKAMPAEFIDAPWALSAAAKLPWRPGRS
jgi:Transposase IS116/IS110/IS902 family